MKVDLCLMTQKGLAVLQALIESNYLALINKIIVGRDENVTNDFAEDIFELCRLNNINAIERNENKKLNAAYTFAISWKWLLNVNDTRLIILHDSLLPRYRGFAPLVAALLNKEKKVGVTSIFATDYYDEGDIIEQQSIALQYPIKIAEVIAQISLLYVDLTISIFEKIKSGEEIKATPQNNALATYSIWRDEADYRINWNRPAAEILNFIYAVSTPYKGAFSNINKNKKIRIHNAEIVNDVVIEHRAVGKVIFTTKSLPVIVCKTGLLMLTEAYDDKTGENVLPFEQFRVRLQ